MGVPQGSDLVARGWRVPPCRSYSFARGQCWEAKAPSCFEQVSPEQSAGQEHSSKPQGSSQPCCKSHRLGTWPQRGDTPPARSPKPPNQKSASAPKAGRCAGTAPEQGVSWLFSVLVPKHWSCGARRLLFDFLFQKEDRRAQAPGRRPSQPELPWASPPGTSSHLSPPKLETACFVWVIFAFFFFGVAGRCCPRSGLAPAADSRKREGPRSYHATSCSRRLLQTFLQHIQLHVTFWVTKVAKTYHQN